MKALWVRWTETQLGAATLAVDLEIRDYPMCKDNGIVVYKWLIMSTVARKAALAMLVFTA